MIQNMTESNFIDAFKQSNRKHNFCYHSLVELYNHYEETEGEDYEFDLVCIDMQWTEFDSLEEYNRDRFGVDNEEDYYESLSDVEEDTLVIVVDYKELQKDNNGHLTNNWINTRKLLIDTEY